MKRSYLRVLSLLVVFSFVLQLFSAFLPDESVSAEEVTSPLINDDGTVTFLYEGQATSVKVAGSFTDWQNGAIDMTEESDGIWTLTKELTEGTYEYKFIVDEAWIRDPSNSNQANGNSVFTIGEPNGSPAIKSPVINEDGTVTFNYESKGETAIYVIGSFNNWDLTTAVELTEKDSIFSTTLSDLEPGEYQYKFIFNKRSWDENSTDPSNPNIIDGNSAFTIESTESVKVQSALMESLNEILVTTNKEFGKQEFVLTDKETNEVIDTTTTILGDKKAKITIADGKSIDVRNEYEVSLGQSEGQIVTMRNVLNLSLIHI